MRIECDTTFLDGIDRFEVNDIRTVDDARAHKFIAHGWAHEVGQAVAPPAPQPSTDLDIHNVLQTSQVTHG